MNLRHEDAFVFRDFVCHSIEVDGDVRIGKETVSAEPFRTGAVGNVADIVLPLLLVVEIVHLHTSHLHTLIGQIFLTHSLGLLL